MPAIAGLSPRFGTGGTVDKRSFAARGRCVLKAIHDWRLRMRQRSELMMLNGVELRELSLTEADVNRELRKPCWESIDINGR